jgi:hypothetical protein
MMLYTALSHQALHRQLAGHAADHLLYSTVSATGEPPSIAGSCQPGTSHTRKGFNPAGKNKTNMLQNNRHKDRKSRLQMWGRHHPTRRHACVCGSLQPTAIPGVDGPSLLPADSHNWHSCWASTLVTMQQHATPASSNSKPTMALLITCDAACQSTPAGSITAGITGSSAAL